MMICLLSVVNMLAAHPLVILMGSRFQSCFSDQFLKRIIDMVPSTLETWDPPISTKGLRQTYDGPRLVHTIVLEALTCVVRCRVSSRNTELMSQSPKAQVSVPAVSLAPPPPSGLCRLLSIQRYDQDQGFVSPNVVSM